jgi:hypothetical protein
MSWKPVKYLNLSDYNTYGDYLGDVSENIAVDYQDLPNVPYDRWKSTGGYKMDTNRPPYVPNIPYEISPNPQYATRYYVWMDEQELNSIPTTYVGDKERTRVPRQSTCGSCSGRCNGRKQSYV